MPRQLEDQELVAMISEAKRALSEAEAALDRAVDGIRVDPDGEKRGLTALVEEAFAKLRSAKHRLSALTARLSSRGD